MAWDSLLTPDECSGFSESRIKLKPSHTSPTRSHGEIEILDTSSHPHYFTVVPLSRQEVVPLSASCGEGDDVTRSKRWEERICEDVDW